MKTILLLLLPLFGISQVKVQPLIDVGLTSAMTPTGRLGLQVSNGFLVGDASFRVTNGAYFTEGLTGGVSFNFRQVRLIATAGGYFHQFRVNEEKGDQRVNTIMFGGQVIVQRGIGIFGMEYNGNYGSVFVGIALFNPKEPCEVCVY